MDDEKKTRKQLIEEIQALRLEQSEQTRIASEKFTKAFLQNSIPTIISTVKEGRIIEASDAFLRIVGLNRNEVVGRTSIEIGYFTQEQRAYFINELNKNGYIENLELEIKARYGALRYGLFNTVMMSINNENYLLTTIQDISKRKLTEERLRESEEQFRTFMESSSIAFLMYQNNKWIYANPAANELTGYTSQELRDLPFAFFAHPDDEEFLQKRAQMRQRGEITEAHRYDARIIAKDGTIKWIDLSGTTIFLKGSPAGIISVMDITERKQSEEELVKYRNHLEDMVKERTAELEKKNITMQALNTTLEVLLKKREDDKNAIEETITMNIRNMINPYLEQMKKGRLDAEQCTRLQIIQTLLQEIANPLMQNMRQFNFTPKEMKVATLVKQGTPTKEIAAILGIAKGSVDVHRKNIRKKLGLSNKKANLQSHLDNLSGR